LLLDFRMLKGELLFRFSMFFTFFLLFVVFWSAVDAVMIRNRRESDTRSRNV
jgi:hypothetical protein